MAKEGEEQGLARAKEQDMEKAVRDLKWYPEYNRGGDNDGISHLDTKHYSDYRDYRSRLHFADKRLVFGETSDRI